MQLGIDSPFQIYTGGNSWEGSIEFTLKHYLEEERDIAIYLFEGGEIFYLHVDRSVIAFAHDANKFRMRVEVVVVSHLWSCLLKKRRSIQGLRWNLEEWKMKQRRQISIAGLPVETILVLYRPKREKHSKDRKRLSKATAVLSVMGCQTDQKRRIS